MINYWDAVREWLEKSENDRDPVAALEHAIQAEKKMGELLEYLGKQLTHRQEVKP